MHWTPEQQLTGYRSREKIEPVRVIGNGRQVHPLPLAAHQISPHWTWEGQAMDVDRYRAAGRVSGVLVLKDGQVLLERYGLGRTKGDRWDSQSTTKSVTAILVGAAIQDGYITSMNDPVTRYIPELTGSAYEGVNVRQLMTMTSGVKFDDDYVHPDGDGTRSWAAPFVNGVDPIVGYMRGLPRADQPGTKFSYKSPDAHLAGMLVINATGMSLAEYLSNRIWQPCGMENHGYWMVDAAGNERGDSGLLVTLPDFARLGQFMLEGGKVGATQVLPPDWLADATSAQVSFAASHRGAIGYGYFWWIYKDAYAALGYGGQAIFVYPKDKVVIAVNSAWLEPRNPESAQAQVAFVEALHAAAVAEH
ncbi:serine hydrolase [Mesorhizobium sp. M0895]|uniref:serine hydrolase domain-containing protein n=1 Tax=Mesorhizobium sp. M0895 TaxID=2957019 RepID=UPI0033393A22